MRATLFLSVALACAGTAVFASPPDFGPELQAVGVNPIQDEMGNFVGFVCPRGVVGLGGDLVGKQNPDFQARCTDIVVAGTSGSDLEGTRAGLQDMGSEETSAVPATEVDYSGEHQGRISKRLANLRAGLPSATAVALGGPATGGNAGSALQRWSLFVDGTFGNGDKDASDVEPGFDLDSRGVTAGVDYRSDARTVMGLAVGYTNLEADLDANAGKLDTDSLGVYFYGSYSGADDWYLDGLLGFTRNDHEQKRRLNYTANGTTVNQTASSDNDSDEFTVSLTAGQYMPMGDWTLSPYGRFDYADVEIDGYRETMSNPNAPGNGLAVRIDDQEYTSITLALGVQAYTEWNAGGALWVPQVSAEYVHEFDNDNDDITGSFADEVSGTKFALPTEEPDRDYFNVGIGVSGFVSDATSVYFNYSSQLGYRDQDLDEFRLGVKVDF